MNQHSSSVNICKTTNSVFLVMKRQQSPYFWCLSKKKCNNILTLLCFPQTLFSLIIMVMTLPSFAQSATKPQQLQPNELANQSIRVATFNVSMDATNYLERGKKGKGSELITALNTGRQQIKNIAEIIQHTRPNVILLNEFDYIKDPSQGIEKFIKGYLNKSQQGASPIDYPYYYYSTVNTGVKLDNSIIGSANLSIKTSDNMPETYGFGHFPGHFGMVLLSQYPIDTNNIRTFQNFLWHHMPEALQPKDPNSGEHWYSDKAWKALRLSSKSHWDIPVILNKNSASEKTIHLLASHPTPPVFDGPENRNGTRNHDEIRFWDDYVTPNSASYIYDDNHKKGGLAAHSRFIILGDQNASPDEGDAINSGIADLLTNPLINNTMTPTSNGGQENSDSKFAKTHTAAWKMRADYVLPSTYGLSITGSGVFWPMKNEPLYRLIEQRSSSSDHRLVWLDLIVK